MDSIKPSSDRVLASSIQFLVDGNEQDAANILLACDLDTEIEDQWDGVYFISIILSGPRFAYEILNQEEHPIRKSIWSAFKAVLPTHLELSNLIARSTLVQIDKGWRNELLEIIRGKGISNQGVVFSPSVKMHTWNNLRFRSKTELKIAEAFDRLEVMFLPNCMTRLGRIPKRENMEADFLVCHRGRWGILEVDGEPFHPPGRTVHDHERDRKFHSHGIMVIQHFDANLCYNDPDKVVKEFIELLCQS